jgi:hypothetical protein
MSGSQQQSSNEISIRTGFDVLTRIVARYRTGGGARYLRSDSASSVAHSGGVCRMMDPVECANSAVDVVADVQDDADDLDTHPVCDVFMVADVFLCGRNARDGLAWRICTWKGSQCRSPI